MLGRKIGKDLFDKSEAEEILLKANLNYLAKGLDCIEEFNLVGTSPQSIFEVQLGMLRALNSPEGMEWLKTPQMRMMAKGIYKKFHNFINGKILNRYQWKYLCGLMEKEELYDRKMFGLLGEIDTDERYYTYLRYLELREVVEEYYSHLPKYPKVEEIEDKAKICSMIEWCIEHEKALNRILRKKADLYKKEYEYESDLFFVMVPSKVSDFLAEADGQHNCFYQCIFDMAFDEKIELIMRDKRNPRRSFVTIEVEDGFIEQAYQACNMPLDKQQRKFLDEYAEVKNLFVMDD